MSVNGNIGETNILHVKLSIIIPALNESRYLDATLRKLPLSETEELIIVDGGSTDDTLPIARQFTDKVFSAKTGRASVMNYGARYAEGEFLLFLHADCILPDNGFALIRKTLSDTTVAAGAFELSINYPGIGFRVIESVANVRSHLTSLMYGDQGMFLRKEVFSSIGGFADMPLMEDIEISKRLKKKGRIVFIKPPIKASPRRWLSEGAVYTTLRDWYIASLYAFFNKSPEKLIDYYKDVR